MPLSRPTHTRQKKQTPVLLFAGIAVLVVLGIGGIVLFASPAPHSDTLENCLSISREPYGISPSVFELLPPPPACFYTAVNPYRAGTFSDPFFFDETYFLQPEFFPTFEKDGMRAWKNPTAGFWGAVGYGAYPYDLSLKLHPGETTRTRFFLFSSAGIRTHQGMRIEPFFTNPADATHVTVRISPVDETDGFILGPSFPKFDPAWVHPVDVEITAQPGIPAETLRVSFRVKSPSARVEEDGVSLFGGDYYSATSYVGERTPVLLNVQIVPLDPSV